MIIHNVNGSPKQSEVYSWKTGAVNKAGTAAATDSASVTAFANLFAPFTNVNGRVRKPTKISVKSSAATLYISINGGDVIAITDTTPFTAEDILINTLGLSDNGANVTATILLQ